MDPGMSSIFLASAPLRRRSEAIGNRHTKALLNASLVLVVLVLSACASTEEAGNGDATREDAPSLRRGFYLEPTTEEVHTIQVYRTGNETAIPLLHLGSNETITVAFDLLESDSRPLSVFFYHADRNWRRDLVPAEYLRSFHRDDLLDYRPSLATDISYVHYAYEFPNSSIDFRLSGNYVLRITEQGLEDEVLFERPFFVSEQSTGVDLRLDNVLVAGRGYTSVQPFVRFTPPTATTNAFDYLVCFVRNDQYASARCTDRPSLAVQPDISFFLDPYESFEPSPAEYFLDLSEIRVGGRIDFTDLSVQPPEAAIAPDYARFSGTGLAPFLNGQTVVESVVRNVIDPEVSAQYARVFFRFVPVDERRVSGRIVLTGSFNNWAYDEENTLTWNPERRRYEVDILLKQGHYEYRYLVENPRLREAMSGAAPRFQNLYTTFIYLSDVRISTDRLISVTGVLMNY